MEINDLLIFVRVIQAGSFSKASKLLGLPKSTVSRRVATLEADLGVPLLHRTTRSLKITDIGAAYYEHGIKITEEIEKASARLANVKTAPSGKLRITAPVEFGNQFLGRITQKFLRKNSKVEVELLLTEKVVDLISEGFDLAVRIGELEDSSLMARKLGTMYMQIYASPEYLKNHDEPKSYTDLARHQCILFTGEDNPSVWQLQGPGGVSKRVRVMGRVSANNMFSIREFAVNGEGVALLPSFFCLDEVKRGRLKPLLKEWVFVSGPIHAVFPGQKFVLPKVRIYIEHLLRELEDVKWRD